MTVIIIVAAAVRISSLCRRLALVDLVKDDRLRGFLFPSSLRRCWGGLLSKEVFRSKTASNADTGGELEITEGS